jgi:hypothetical protein
MSMKKVCWLLLLTGCGACQDLEPAEVREPRRVQVERILISYRGNPLKIPARRSFDEAGALARRIFDRARAGEDFVELRNSYSDDRSESGETAIGPYIVLNHGLQPTRTLLHVARMMRGAMGKRFGDVAFRMQVGEIALVEHDDDDYPAGWEIILCVNRDDRTQERVEVDSKKTVPVKAPD